MDGTVDGTARGMLHRFAPQTSSPSAPPAALAHAVLATGLADAARLEAWRTRPEDLRDVGVDQSGLDLECLADFAGLAEKVRHNQCRPHLQLTFRLLGLTGLEIELFRNYAPTSLHRRRRGLLSLEQRLDGLLEFVEGWAGRDGHVRTLVRDVLRHEHALATLSSGAGGAGIADRLDGKRPDGSVPAHDGRLIVYRMTCDPAQVAAVLRAREPDLSQVARRDVTLVYQGSPWWGLRLVEVEPAIGDLLLMADGQTDLGEIARQLRVEGHAIETLRGAVEDLTVAGLLTLRKAGEDHPCD